MSKKTIITEATLADIQELAPRLREADRAEVEAATGNADPLPTLVSSFESSSLVWAGRVGGELLCVFGVVVPSILSGVGIPWLLGSDAIEKNSRKFMRKTKPYMARMDALCPQMVNYVDARNTKSIKWLTRLGFTILDPEPWGAHQLPFHRFERSTLNV